MEQVIIRGRDKYKEIESILNKHKCEKFMLVCGASLRKSTAYDYFEQIKVPYIVFSEYKSNPCYEDICNGVELFKAEKCDAVVAVGGGSAIDVAKCIKLYSTMETSQSYIEQEAENNDILLIAIPTTAGSGSESTKFAVMYYKGNKQSVVHESLRPRYAILDSGFLSTLPLYQKKCTLLDALCQAIESWWSINSNAESRKYSKMAIEIIVANMEEYLSEQTTNADDKIMLASNYSGRAINITQTTAPHAMSYKLTSLYGIPHGHAVAICLVEVWEYMQDYYEKDREKSGNNLLLNTLEEIANAFGVHSSAEGFGMLRMLLKRLDIKPPIAEAKDIEVLASSVDPVRLKNHPICMNKQDFIYLYKKILFM